MNETFQAGYRGDPGTAVAVAKSPYIVGLHMPPQYRLNTPRSCASLWTFRSSSIRVCWMFPATTGATIIAPIDNV